MVRAFGVAVLAATGVACGGGGGGGGAGGAGKAAECLSVNTYRSYTDGTCAGCSISDAPAVVDGSLYSFAGVEPLLASSQVSIRAGSGGAVYEAGTVAAFITVRLPGGGTSTPTLRTYRSGALVESATGPSVTRQEASGGTDAESMVSFQTLLPFDAVEISLDVAGNTSPSQADVRIYELCARGSV
jgi:hypothetical protein